MADSYPERNHRLRHHLPAELSASRLSGGKEDPYIILLFLLSEISADGDKEVEASVAYIAHLHVVRMKTVNQRETW